VILLIVAVDDLDDIVEVDAGEIPLVTALLGPRMISSRSQFCQLKSRLDRLQFLGRRLTACVDRDVPGLDGTDHTVMTDRMVPHRRGHASTSVRRRPEGVFAIKPTDWNKEEDSVLVRLVKSFDALPVLNYVDDEADVDAQSPPHNASAGISTAVYKRTPAGKM